MKKTLDEIAVSYGTDKSSKAHFYTKHYESNFEKLRLSKLKILEIGVQDGFSLKTWKEYFENSDIYGIDLTDLTVFNEDRITVLVGNQSDTNFLLNVNNTYGPFDIIIDDGSHKSNDIRASFNILFPLLKEGGIYVIEDLHTNYWEKKNFIPSWFINEKHTTFIDDIKNLIDSVNSGGKSGYANRDFDESSSMEEMTWWEKNVESISMYRSICFIKKI